MLPSLSNLDLVIASDACDEGPTLCPLPMPHMWESTPAYRTSDRADTMGAQVGPDEWDSGITSLLHLSGYGRFHNQRMTLHDQSDPSEGRSLSSDGLMLSDNYAATYAGGQKYILNTGFFSLYGGRQTREWTVDNGTEVEFNRTLPLAYLDGHIPSVSFGLHVGSVWPEVPPSLWLGGYDSSRMLSPAVVTNSDKFVLSEVKLGTSNYAYVSAADRAQACVTC